MTQFRESDVVRDCSGRFSNQDHDENPSGMQTLSASSELNVVPVSVLSDDEFDDAIADLEDFAMSDEASREDCIAVAYAVDAIEDGRAVGAEVLSTRDEKGTVRAAMSLMTRTNDGPPHLLINSSGSTMPGSNSAMLHVAMQRALDKDLPLYLIPTDFSQHYWVRHGAVRVPDSRDGFYEYSADAMRRALRGERLDVDETDSAAQHGLSKKFDDGTSMSRTVCTCGADFVASTVVDAMSQLRVHIRDVGGES